MKETTLLMWVTTTCHAFNVTAFLDCIRDISDKIKIGQIDKHLQVSFDPDIVNMTQIAPTITRCARQNGYVGNIGFLQDAQGYEGVLTGELAQLKEVSDTSVVRLLQGCDLHPGHSKRECNS